MPWSLVVIILAVKIQLLIFFISLDPVLTSLFLQIGWIHTRQILSDEDFHELLLLRIFIFIHSFLDICIIYI